MYFLFSKCWSCGQEVFRNSEDSLTMLRCVGGKTWFVCGPCDVRWTESSPGDAMREAMTDGGQVPSAAPWQGLRMPTYLPGAVWD